MRRNKAFIGIILFISIMLFGGCGNKFGIDSFTQGEKTQFFALMEQTSSARYAKFMHNKKAQMTLLNKACKHNLGLACWIYAYEDNGDKKARSIPLERAALMLKNTCLVMATQKPSIASGQSCAFLGVMLSQYPQMQVHIWELIGRNIKIDWLYQKACEMGEGWGCYRLSYDFLQQKDLQSALKVANDGLKMTAMMCDRGVGYYCALSGAMYQYPLENFVQSEEIRQERMRYFWEKGCLKKDGDSCFYLENLNNGEFKTAYYPNKALPNKALQGGATNKRKKSIKSFSDELDYSKILDSARKNKNVDNDKDANKDVARSEPNKTDSTQQTTKQSKPQTPNQKQADSSVDSSKADISNTSPNALDSATSKSVQPKPPKEQKEPSSSQPSTQNTNQDATTNNQDSSLN